MMQVIRKLKKELEQEYGIDNALAIADCLYGAGIYELTNEHKKIIEFLQGVCEDFSSENFYLSCILTENTFESINERYHKYVGYTDQKRLSMDFLSVSYSIIDGYYHHFKESGFYGDQLKILMNKIAALGHAAKKHKDMVIATKAFSVFYITDETRNQFILENAGLLYNDYSRNIDSLFQQLVDEYGREQGFEVLTLHPEIIRLGLSVCEKSGLRSE